MYVLKITIAATNKAQRIIAQPTSLIDNSNTSFQWMTAQNQGSNNITLGDYQVATNGGIIIPPGSPGGALTGTLPIDYSGDLKEFYVYGTQNDVLILMVFP